METNKSLELLTEGVKEFEAKKVEFQKFTEEAKTLKIKGIKDKEGLKVVKSTLREAVSNRTGIVKIDKSISRELNNLKKEAKSMAAELIEILAAGEEHLKGEKERYEKLVEEEKGKKRKEALALVKKRVEAVLEKGGIHVNFDGVTYSFRSWKVDLMQLETMKDEEFEGHLSGLVVGDAREREESIAPYRKYLVDGVDYQSLSDYDFEILIEALKAEKDRLDNLELENERMRKELEELRSKKVAEPEPEPEINVTTSDNSSSELPADDVTTWEIPLFEPSGEPQKSITIVGRKTPPNGCIEELQAFVEDLKGHMLTNVPELHNEEVLEVYKTLEIKIDVATQQATRELMKIK